MPNEVGPIYGVELLKTLPLDGGMLQALPSRRDLDEIWKRNLRVVAGYEVLLEHYRRGQAEIKRLTHSLLECHRRACTKDNCNLDGGPEHETAFGAAEAAKEAKHEQ